MAELSPERQRALRRRHKHERQAVIYGTLVAALALAGLGSAAVYTGVLSVPLLDREFTTPEPDAVAALPDPPCLPEGTLPVAYNSIQVAVLNSSNRAGLAGQTATSLTERGFLVLGTGDFPGGLVTPSQINFGEPGIGAAYTLAASVDAPLMVLDTRADATVDLILGESFAGLLDPSIVVLDPAVPLASPPECVPLELARTNAVPAPVNPEPEAPAEGEVVVPEGEVAPAPEG